MTSSIRMIFSGLNPFNKKGRGLSSPFFYFHANPSNTAPIVMHMIHKGVFVLSLSRDNWWSSIRANITTVIPIPPTE